MKRNKHVHNTHVQTLLGVPVAGYSLIAYVGSHKHADCTLEVNSMKCTDFRTRPHVMSPFALRPPILSCDSEILQLALNVSLSLSKS